MLSSGANVTIWEKMISSGANVIMVSSRANVIIRCYHVMLSSGTITHPFFIFPENFTHSRERWRGKDGKIGEDGVKKRRSGRRKGKGRRKMKESRRWGESRDW
jgi:hypothetical protein